MKVRDRIVSWATLLCFVAGAALGLIRADWAQRIAFIGTAYVTALKYLALPALILSVFSAAGKGGKTAAGVLVRTLILFVAMFSATFLLCAIPYTVLSPGKGFQFMGETAWAGERASVTLGSVLQNIFSPGGKISVNTLYFPCLIAALVAGLIVGWCKLERLQKGAAKLERFFMKLLSCVMLTTPLGVLSLMATCTGTFGFETLRTSGVYVAWAYGGCLLALATVMILPLWAFCGVKPGQYFSSTGRLFLTALSTCSSAATLPETMRTCREGFGVSDEITGIVVPLGCTVHMCGCPSVCLACSSCR